jgi:putative transposase
LQAARRRTAREPGSRSSRRERATYGLIAELCGRQSRRREDWLHKTTTNLAKSHGLIVLEDLHVKNMTRSAGGTMKQPGVNVRAKAGMNRSILGMAWGTVERMLAYKSQDCGGVLVKVPAAYSSQTCARCGHVTADSRVSRDWFACRACGHRLPADINAARVLLARGLATRTGTAPGHGVAGRGALAAGRAVKRQLLLAGSLPSRSCGEIPTHRVGVDASG